MVFKNRQEAGELLVNKLISDQLIKGTEKEDLVVVAIPRGGVVVGRVVADRLGCPLSLVVTKKVGAPGQEELAVGAMGPDGNIVWDERLLGSLGLRKEDLVPQIKNLKVKIQNYKEKFEVKDLRLEGKTVILVDDGIATGRTMEAAIRWLKTKDQKPKAIIVAVPVCAKETAVEIKRLADEWVCLEESEWFGAVGQFYEDFPQVSDEEVEQLLATGASV